VPPKFVSKESSMNYMKTVKQTFELDTESRRAFTYMSIFYRFFSSSSNNACDWKMD
jgi:hypothetical protein